ncbi:adhesion component ABC transporter ATP-binding protein [Mycobacterium tuberculosis variant bovis BCG]|nr:adhesion component ABC transporter ATP-binding protein [Mycobacterium tuberculosis variant bovis BCG]
MNRQPIVQLSNLSWTFREGETRRQVLDHITFDFEPGEFVALLGQSGSGKSTLLNLISGIEKPPQVTSQLMGSLSLRKPSETGRCSGAIRLASSFNFST